MGKLFKYTPKNRVPLVYKKILNIQIGTGILICDCIDIFKPIIIPYIPDIMPRYIGLIKLDGDYLLYELTQELKKDKILDYYILKKYYKDGEQL